MKKVLFPMNLQFFAEDGADANEAEAVNQPEGTEDVSTEEVETSETEEAAEPQPQSDAANKAFASMRRELEAAKRREEELNKMFASQFGEYKNPVTGQPITDARGYAEAFAAQQRLQMEEQLKQNNIDPKIIDRMIQDSPAVKAAEAATAELNEIKSQQMLERDIKTVLELDPTLNSAEDLYKDPKMPEIIERINAGMSLVDAYKIVNFDRLTGAKGEAAKQAAINSVKAKNHLTTGTSLDVGDSGEDIPADMIEMYKESFPEKSMAELKALYNKAIKSRR